ncbi:hypothetical protein AB1Y20_003300 [Prymnesium parvum]|uniref:Uncharacterized protein n=1 Tax=Prymnesium parvum TaxID=97485 RepID=A0AB34JCW8_PRYPA
MTCTGDVVATTEGAYDVSTRERQSSSAHAAEGATVRVCDAIDAAELTPTGLISAAGDSERWHASRPYTVREKDQHPAAMERARWPNAGERPRAAAGPQGRSGNALGEANFDAGAQETWRPRAS